MSALMSPSKFPLVRITQSRENRPVAKANVNFPPQDRQRVRRACKSCREKKIKCNGEEPCRRCVLYGTDCEYVEFRDSAKLTTPNRSGGSNDSLERQIASLKEIFEKRVGSIERLLDRLMSQHAEFKSSENQLDPMNAARNNVDAATWSDSVDITLEPSGPGENHDVGLSLMQRHVEAQTQRNSSEELISGEEAELMSDADCVEPSINRDAAASDEDYADEFGGLNTDVNGHFRYVGLGSTASIVDRCTDLRRHIDAGLKKKGYETWQTYLTSPEATVDHQAPSPAQASSIRIPPETLVDALLETYGQELFPVFPIISERELRVIYENLLENGDSDTGEAAVFFSALAATVLLIPQGSSILEGVEYSESTVGGHFYSLGLHFASIPTNFKRVVEGRSPQNNSIAFGLLSLYLAEMGSQAEAWIMIGRAVRIAQDVGLHRSPERLHIPLRVRSKRRLIWWSLYVLERQLSTSLGRPLAIDDADCDVEVPCEANDGLLATKITNFISLIHLHKILGVTLRTVNSVQNASDWQDSKKFEELRTKVREINDSLQHWAKNQVHEEIKSATEGGRLMEKHISLSCYFLVVVLLYRVFLPSPHRKSPLRKSEAERRCIKAATDCLHGSSDFLQHVRNPHYRILHGQNVFVCAVILLQCIKSSEDQTYIDSAVQDVQRALQSLRHLDWKGSYKCQGIIEEYLELAVHVQRGHYPNGCCNFEHPTERGNRKHAPYRFENGGKRRSAGDHSERTSSRNPKRARHEPCAVHQTNVASANQPLINCSGRMTGFLPIEAGLGTGTLPAGNGMDRENFELGIDSNLLFADPFADLLNLGSQGTWMNGLDFGNSFSAIELSHFDAQSWVIGM